MRLKTIIAFETLFYIFEKKSYLAYQITVLVHSQGVGNFSFVVAEVVFDDGFQVLEEDLHADQLFRFRVGLTIGGLTKKIHLA